MKLPRSVMVVLTPLLAGNAVAGDFTFTTGAEYTHGDYGTGVTTSSWYIPFSVGYAADTFAWSVTVPYIRVDGSDLVTGIRSTPIRGPGSRPGQITTGTERVDGGLGDITLRASYQLMEETPAKPWLAATGKVKLGTADEEKNLGTGENDYAVQFEAAKGMFDGFIGYNFLGDPNGIDYDDIIYGAGAITLPLQQPWRTRAEFYMEEAPLSGLDPVSELTVSFTRPLPRDRNINLYFVTGFSDSSPDWGVGALISTGF